MEKVAKKLQNNKTHKYYCKSCLYGCNNKTNFEKHKNTYKHLKLTNASFTLQKKLPSKNKCEFCGKIFNHRQSLHRHKKTCKMRLSQSPKVSKSLQKVSNEFLCECGKKYKSKSGFYKHKTLCKYLHDEEDNESDKEDIIPTNNVEKLLKSIMLDNKAILKENQILRNKLSNLETNVTNITNNTQNNHLNINMFLNEKCKNAMNIEDFIEKIKLSLEDLNYTKDNGYTKGISNIFIKNLTDMDVTERPIHCSDQKRMQFYVKDADEWKKDKNNEKLDDTIKKVSKKQIQNLEKWVKANPDYLDSDSKTQEYYKLVRNLTQQDDDINLRKIKKKVGENVKIDK